MSIKHSPGAMTTAGVSLMDLNSKEWSTVFSDCSHFKDNGSYVACKRGMNVDDDDDLAIFLKDSENSVPFSTVDEVTEYCQNDSLGDLKPGPGTEETEQSQRRAAWLDDRTFSDKISSRPFRRYQNPLTSTDLCVLLKELRFDHMNLPDADRRLISIVDLDPQYILALAETAPHHQVSILRDGMWKYLALQTSIRVRIPPRGFPIFQMELHLPYFALRTSTPLENKSQIRKPPRKWTSLSFLKIPTPEGQPTRAYGIYEAQISFVICGPDDSRWVGYMFEDADIDDEAWSEEDFSYEGFQADPIAADGTVDANLPIQDPREYYLVVFKSRIAQVWREWQCLIRTIERSIERHRQPPTLSGRFRSMEDSGGDLKKTLDWTLETLELLSMLLRRLSETIKAWQRFSSPTGDFGYFSDMGYREGASQNTSQCARLSLRAIKEKFEMLEDLQQKLVALEDHCQHSAQALQLRLTLDGNEATQHNGVTSHLSVLISPVTMATAYFSMPRALIPFELNSKSFAIVLIVLFISVQLGLFILDTLLRRSSWWSRIAEWMCSVQLNGKASNIWTTRVANMMVSNLSANRDTIIIASNLSTNLDTEEASPRTVQNDPAKFSMELQDFGV